MHRKPLIDSASGPALGESRARVLELLRVAGAPLGVREVAERAGLHLNTARFHLDGLVEAGLAERRAEDRQRPGRPRVVYAAVATEQAGPRSYRLLAAMLSTLVDHVVPDPREAALAAGEQWGRYLAERPAPFERIDAEAAIRRLTTVLADLGFTTGEVDEHLPRTLPLRHCPFREIAESHTDVVCSLHLGLMRGVLSEVGAPVTAERLEPFVEPSLCVAHLAARDSSDAAGPG
ncbi:helix-turn-helix transcriptional regulator [Saccharomonospora xinjiangensis]|nr:helix-turn-helix domain-containing protein [Saccharomonospora xinjiangensis]